MIRGWLLRVACGCWTLVACAAGAMWLRSYGHFDRVVFEEPLEVAWKLDSSFGVLSLARYRDPPRFGGMMVLVNAREDSFSPRLMPVGLSARPSRPARVYFEEPAGLHEHAAQLRRTASGSSPAFVWDHHWLSRTDLARVMLFETAFPHWVVVAFAAASAGLCWLGALRAFRRRRAGACGACGYDLRATPNRCPECGAAAKPVGGVAS